MTASSQPEEAHELVAAAKRDQHALVILSRDAQAPAEIALFLAQQAIEKSIKSVFAMHGVVYRVPMTCWYWRRWRTKLALLCPWIMICWPASDPMRWSFDTWGTRHPTCPLPKR